MDAEHENRLLDLMRRYDKAIWRRCMRHAIGDAAWAGDLEQEVVLRIWQRLGTLSAEPGSPGEVAWVMKVAQSVLSGRPRSTGHVREGLAGDIADTDGDEARRKRELLEELGAYLPEQDRLLLGLMMEGYRNREIAGMLSITAGAVGVRIHRMAARMREIYNKLYNNKP